MFHVNNRSTFDGDKRKNDFYILIFVPSDLDLWPLDLKFASLVTLVQGDVSTKLEVSMAFLLRDNQRHARDGRTDGRTDGQSATFNADPWGVARSRSNIQL